MKPHFLKNKFCFQITLTLKKKSARTSDIVNWTRTFKQISYNNSIEFCVKKEEKEWFQKLQLIKYENKDADF